MKLAVIDNNRCDRSPFCPVKRVCPFGAVTQEFGKAPVIDESKCTGCSKCVMVCPMGAVSIEKTQ